MVEINKIPIEPPLPRVARLVPTLHLCSYISVIPLSMMFECVYVCVCVCDWEEGGGVN